MHYWAALRRSWWVVVSYQREPPALGAVQHRGSHGVDDNSWEDYPAFAPLRDKAVFRSAAPEYSVPVWQGGKIELAPEARFAVGITIKNRETA